MSVCEIAARKLALMLAIAGAVYLIVSLGEGSSVRAHSYIYHSEVSRTLCLGGNSVSSLHLYDNMPSQDETWTVTTGTGLMNGDRLQDARFRWHIEDESVYSYGIEVAEAGHSVRDWVTGSHGFWDSMTTHIDSSLDVELYFHNADYFSQCYYLKAEVFSY